MLKTVIKTVGIYEIQREQGIGVSPVKVGYAENHFGVAGLN